MTCLSTDLSDYLNRLLGSATFGNFLEEVRARTPWLVPLAVAHWDADPDREGTYFPPARVCLADLLDEFYANN